KPAREQRPDAVVVNRAVDEEEARQRGIERLAAGVGIRALTMDLKLHQAPAFCAAFSARDRSSMRSALSSRPIDKRIVPAVMPACASAASSMRKCVVDAGWITSERQSPT